MNDSKTYQPSAGLGWGAASGAPPWFSDKKTFSVRNWFICFW